VSTDVVEPTLLSTGSVPATERPRPRWAVDLDNLMAAAVAAFAWWTILREVVLVTGSSTTPFVIAWLVTSPLIMVPVARWNRRSSASPDLPPASPDLPPASPDLPRASPEPPGTSCGGWVPPSRTTSLGILLCVGAAAALLSTTGVLTFSLGWVLGLAALGLIGREIRLRTRATGAGAEAPAIVAVTGSATGTGLSRRLHLQDGTAAIVSVGVAVMSLFERRGAGDDAYYVNLSTWTAEHGHIPLRDTMYGPEVYPSTYGGGYPLTSVETLFGALARLVHLQAGTMTYLIAAPICTFAFVWVLWQLATVCMRRQALPTFLFSVAFILVGSGGTWRSYPSRIWEGKAIAVTVLVPLIWIFAIRLARTRDRHWTVLLFLAGISFVGLTSSASLLGLVLAGIIVVAGVLTRDPALRWGGVALAVAPAVSGVVIALAGSVGGAHPATPTLWGSLRGAYGADPLIDAITIAALLLSPLVLRRSAALLVWTAGLASLAVFTPGVLALVNALTRSGPVEWRLLLAPPIPTLIGACAATAVAVVSGAFGGGRVARYGTAAVAVAAVATVALAGTPLWGAGTWQRPTWDVDPAQLANVRALMASGPSTAGPVLMPPGEMLVLAIATTQVFAVVPRAYDLPGLQEPPAETTARRLLLSLVSQGHKELPTADVQSALRLLHVQTVCLRPSAHKDRQTVQSLGFSAWRPIGALVCSTRTG